LHFPLHFGLFSDNLKFVTHYFSSSSVSAKAFTANEGGWTMVVKLIEEYLVQKP